DLHRGGVQRHRGRDGPHRGDARLSRAVEASGDRHPRGPRGGAGPEHRARREPLLPRPVEFQGLRVGALLRVAGADHARRAHRMAPLDPDAAAGFASGDRRRAAGVGRTMTAAAPATIGKFVLRTFLWLPPCFAAWYLAAPQVAPVVGGAARLL